MTNPEKTPEITPEMVMAGSEVLAAWKLEQDVISDVRAAEEVFTAMLKVASEHKKTHKG